MIRTEPFPTALQHAAYASPSARRRVVPALAVLAFVVVVGVDVLRIARNLNVPGEPMLRRYALADFRDAIYYPTIALLDGVNPYDSPALKASYPVGKLFPLYGPHTMLVHLPFAAFPPRAAGLAYVAILIALTPLVAALVLRMCALPAGLTNICALSALMLLSRPGQSNLFLGQYALTMALGLYVALHYADRRAWLAGLGLALCAVKPTYGVPLAILMLAGGTVAAVAYGAAITLALCALVAPLLLNAAGGVGPFLAAIPGNYAATMSLDPSAHAALSPTRLDVVSLAARALGSEIGSVVELTIFTVMLVLGGMAVARLSRSPARGARSLSAIVICLTILCAVYHQAYDALILVLPLTALIAAPNCLPAMSPARRWLLAALLAVPALNYVSSFAVLTYLGIGPGGSALLTSINAAALLLAWFVCVDLAFRVAPAVSAPRAAVSASRAHG